MKDLERLFKKFKEFKIVAKEQEEREKKKGLNDYNILSITHKNSDELMHSKMIASLLDINGKHYQDDLFLKKFFNIIQVDDFQFKSAKIELEKSGQNLKDGRIDIYITDGEKHIIIENKINADDQKRQIQRYVEIIYQNNEEIDPDDILILYLSKNGKLPSKYSLGTLEINNNYLVENNKNKAKFKIISYENEILNWLNQCILEVENISNLKESLRIYKEVVEKITNKYRNKGVDMSDFLINNLDFIEDVYILHNNFPSSMAKVANKFMKELEKYSNLECVNSKIDNQNIVYNLDKLKKWFDKGFKDRKNIGSFLKINNKWLLFFWFGDINFHIGVVPYNIEDEIINFFKTSDRHKIFNTLKTRLKKGDVRNWSTLGGEKCCFTINYGNFKEKYNSNLVECIKENECEIKKDIIKILEFFNENNNL
jgi:hypothetical protein